jgi:hypothetical protein
MEDTGKWGFLVLLLLILGPLLFWVVSLLIAWVKWLFVGKKELNDSFAVMKEFRGPISHKSIIDYELGTSGDVIIRLLDENFKEIKLLLKDYIDKGAHFLEFDTTAVNNGVYFCELITDTQKTQKRLIIRN